MAGGFTEKERVEIRQRLLDSGYELSAEIGIKKMTIAMIAKNTGVAVGTFYNFFASTGGEQGFEFLNTEDYETCTAVI